MRTMFTSLILICLLGQLAETQDSPREKKKRGEFSECGTVYDCYVPGSCLNPDEVTDPKIELEDSEVVDVTSGRSVYSDCPALIRIHQYAQYKALVIIEGLLESTTSIKLHRKVPGDPRIEATFSCERTPVSQPPDKLTGTYNIFVEEKPDKPITDSQPMTYTANTKKIKCEIEVDLKRKKYMIFGKPEVTFLKAQITIKSGAIEKSTVSENIRFNIPISKCNRDSLIYVKEKDDLTKKYEKISYDFKDPIKYYCGDVYEMEYKLKETDPYKKMSKLKCKGQKFQVFESDTNNPTHPAVTEVFVRCVADLLLFCDKGVKLFGNSGPYYTPPDKVNRSPSKLLCEPEKPHLVVKGIPGLERPIKNPEFACLPFGKKQFWTVKKPNGKPHRLEPNNPEVYCTKELDCNLNLPIFENQVMNGDLDEKLFVPKCFEKGELKVIDGSEEIKIATPYCNRETGHYEYKELEGTKRTGTINQTTKFLCAVVHEEVDEALVAKKRNTMVIGSVAGFVIAGIIMAAIVATISYFAIQKQKKMRAAQKAREMQQIEAENKAWMRWCTTKNEKEFYKDEHPEPKKPEKPKNSEKGEGSEKEASVKEEAVKEKSVKETTENHLWNTMLMDFQRKGRELAGPAEDLAKPRQDRALWFDPKDFKTERKPLLQFYRMGVETKRKRAPEIIGRFNQHIYEDSNEDELAFEWNEVYDKVSTARASGEMQYNWERMAEGEILNLPCPEDPPADLFRVRLDGAEKDPPT